ncbi:HD domain-containing protein [Sulfurimonas sp.]|nr:HD domain-containing protein [Sulfurimonas sp.]
MDKTLINEGVMFEFDIFVSSSSNSGLKIFKGKNSVITNNDITILSSIEEIFIQEKYKERYKMSLKTITQSISSKEDRKEEFEKHSKEIYSNATLVLENLFDNPETLGNYENSKSVVNDLVGNILDDDFTLKSLMHIAEHDFYTHTHSLNVAIYSMCLGSFLKLDQKALAELGESALLHDLGKSKIDPAIINKDGKLTDKEFRTMMAHSSLGYTIGLKIGIKNKNVLHGIKYHHEKMDGTGYPEGLLGTGIPLFARIIGLCDIFDALTSKRSYKEAMTTFEAVKLIKTHMSGHVDLKLLNSLLLMFR